MVHIENLPQLDCFLAEVEQLPPLSIFFPLAAEYGFLAPADWQDWARRHLSQVEHKDRWLTNLATAQSAYDLRNALSERTEAVPIAGFWGYYDLLEAGMRALSQRQGRMTLAEVLAESSGTLHHKPAGLDEQTIVRAISHLEGRESHPAEQMQALAVLDRLGDHAARLFTILNLPPRSEPPAPTAR